jgi:hypothetical protein
MGALPGFFAGKIGYYGPEGENGREWFEMIPHAQGRTLRAFCEMDNFGLSRDVTLSLDSNSRPVDGFVRVIQDGQIRGSSLFLVQSDAVACEASTFQLGRISQRKPLAAPLHYLGLHPLVGDALVALSRGTDRPGEFVMTHGITNSKSPNGELGLIAEPTLIDVAYLGEARISVAAGDFDARHYALRWSPQWPPAQLWVHGPLALFLRLTWSLIDARYELNELRTTR